MLSPMYSYDGENIIEPISDSPELIHKTAEVLHVYSGNIVDTTGKTAPGSTLDNSITFDGFENDIYYSNPFTTDTGKSIALYPKDKDGNAVYFTMETGTRSYYYELMSGGIYQIKINGLEFEIKGYTSFVNFQADEATYGRKIVLDSKPAYWVFGGNGYTEGDPIERGFTQGYYDDEYVAYSDPVKTYVYTEELNKHIDKHTDQLRDEILLPSENLLDYSKINWHAYSGYYRLEKGYYMPVEAGDIVESNNTAISYIFYDSTYTQLSTQSASVPYLPITVPQNAAWMRIYLSAGFINEGDPLMVWKARSEESARYERPIFRPSKKNQC